MEIAWLKNATADSAIAQPADTLWSSTDRGEDGEDDAIIVEAVSESANGAWMSGKRLEGRGERGAEDDGEKFTQRWPRRRIDSRRTTR